MSDYINTSNFLNRTPERLSKIDLLVTEEENIADAMDDYEDELNIRLMNADLVNRKSDVNTNEIL